MATTGRWSQSGELSKDISRALVALFKDATGRGATRVRTYLMQDLVVTVLHDTMTQAERTLMAEEETETVRDLRRIFQGALRDEAIKTVQELTGRKVLAFLSDHAVDHDYAIEAFVLEPGLEEAD